MSLVDYHHSLTLWPDSGPYQCWGLASVRPISRASQALPLVVPQLDGEYQRVNHYKAVVLGGRGLRRQTELPDQSPQLVRFELGVGGHFGAVRTGGLE